MRKSLSTLLIIVLLCVGVGIFYHVKKTHDKLHLPTDFKTITRDTRLAAGYRQSLYIDNNGQLWAWGNTYLSNNVSREPVKVADNVCAAAAGETTDTGFYLDCNGNLYGWGETQYGQVGIISNDVITHPIKLMENIKTINAGNDTIYAIDTFGSLWAWGKDNPSRGKDMPDEDPVKQSPTPKKVLDLVQLVASSNTHTLALREDRSLWVWGRNTHGALAIGSNINQERPYKANIGAIKSKPIAKIATKNNASFAVTTDGELFAWGEAHTALPDTNETEFPHRTLPGKVEFIDNVADIALGESSVLVLKKDGSVWIYGSSPIIPDSHGAWSKPVKLIDNAIEIAAGPDHALVLTADGAIYAWGDNEFGQLGIGENINFATMRRVNFNN